MTHSHRLTALWLSVTLFCVPASFGQAKKDQAQTVTEQKKGVEDPKAPVSLAVGAPVDPKTYKLGPEDVVGIRVWREADLSGAVMIRPDGKISMPLIGEITAAGETPDSLAKLITESLSKVLNRPEVFIQVMQVNSKKYFISGEVNKVGQFSLVTPTTVLEALSIAGGLREYASKSKITIVRSNQRLKFNYKEVIEGKNLKQNIYLENGDHIIVP